MPISDTNKEYVDALLAEYASMRSQIVARGVSIVQVASIGVASLTLAATSLSWGWDRKGPGAVPEAVYLFCFLFVFLLSLIGVMWRLNYRDTTREAAHVRRLERAINQRLGAQLLAWESEFGLAGLGFTVEFWPKPRDVLRFGMNIRAGLPFLVGIVVALMCWAKQSVCWLRYGESCHSSLKTTWGSAATALQSTTWVGWGHIADWLANLNLGFAVLLAGAILWPLVALLRFLFAQVVGRMRPRNFR